MARICFYCGKELAPGEPCSCRQARINAEERAHRSGNPAAATSSDAESRCEAGAETTEAGGKPQRSSEADDAKQDASASATQTSATEKHGRVHPVGGVRFEEKLRRTAMSAVSKLRGTGEAFFRKSASFGAKLRGATAATAQAGEASSSSGAGAFADSFDPDSSASAEGAARGETPSARPPRTKQDFRAAGHRFSVVLDRIRRGAAALLRFFSCMGTYLLRLFRDPASIFALGQKMSMRTCAALVLLQSFLCGFLLLRLGGATSLGQILGCRIRPGIFFSDAELIWLFLRGIGLSALYFALRSFFYRFSLILFTGRRYLWSECLRFQMPGYIYFIFFTFSAFCMAQGSGISSFFMLGLAVALQMLVDHICIEQSTSLSKERAFSLVLYVTLLSLLGLAFAVRIVLPQIRHYCVAPRNWL